MSPQRLRLGKFWSGDSRSKSVYFLGHVTTMQVDDALREALDSQAAEQLECTAREMAHSISTLLHSPDSQQQQHANRALTAYCEEPQTWTVALYLAFPPSPPSPPPSFSVPLDIRFFALNILLAKVRSDSGQLSEGDAIEIYDALVRQLASCSDPVVRARLCIVIAATAAVAGPDTCYEVRTLATCVF